MLSYVTSSELMRPPAYSRIPRLPTEDCSDEFYAFTKANALSGEERIYSVQRVSDKVAKNHLALNIFLNLGAILGVILSSVLLDWVEFPETNLKVNLWEVTKEKSGQTCNFIIFTMFSGEKCMDVIDEETICDNMFFFFLAALGYTFFAGLGVVLNLYGVICIVNIIRGTKNKHLARTFMVKFSYLFYWTALAIWIAVSRMIIYLKYLRPAPLCVFLFGIFALFTKWHFKVYKGQLERKRDINLLLSAT